MTSDAIRGKGNKVRRGFGSSEGKAIPARSAVWRMFDRIAPRYDLLNRLLSLGQDVVWRNRLARNFPDHGKLEVLDLATGTTDVLITLFRRGTRIEYAVGIDMAQKMLTRGKKKVDAQGLSDRVSLVRTDAERLPFANASFDIVTMAFGIRNVADASQALSEMHRVLKPGGTALILEFSLPRNRFLRCLHLFYLREIVPRLGAIISGDSYAYRYLNETIETFPYGELFCKMMGQAGFVSVVAVPLTFGAATIYRGSMLADMSNGTEGAAG